jgi:predicted GIY-YIG superfamily endonuclease
MFCYIYKLIHKDATNDDMVYIGSSCDITERMKEHKKKCYYPKCKEYNNKLYKYIRENDGYDAWKCEIIDEIEITFKKDQKRFVYEGECTRKYDAINKLNSEIAGRTKKVYNKDNIEKVKERNKKYYENNIEKVKERNKKWRENNPERKNELAKKYYENNKENINKIICCNICGSFVNKSALAKHHKTQKCINFPNK